MRIVKIIFIAMFALLMFSPQLFSHSPEKIELTFNPETKILEVNVEHEVRNVEKHYVEKIEVFLNDDLRIVQNFKRQESKMAQNATFFLFDPEIGDKIKVKAECSIHGEETKEIIVKEKEVKK